MPNKSAYPFRVRLSRTSRLLVVIGAIYDIKSYGDCLFYAAIILRIVLFFYGIYQDNHSALKFTDIDYYVFTDAAEFVANGQSAFSRETYRYSPLPAWLLVPTSWGVYSWHLGKVIFATGDLVAGYLLVEVLQDGGMVTSKAQKLTTLWLLNPMVAIVSTRGSSEGLLCAIVIATVWSVLKGRYVLSGCFLALATHLKIYPFLYGASLLCYLDEKNCIRQHGRIYARLPWLTKSRLEFAVSAISFFFFLTFIAYWV